MLPPPMRHGKQGVYFETPAVLRFIRMLKPTYRQRRPKRHVW